MIIVKTNKPFLFQTTLCFLEKCMDRAFLVGQVVPQTLNSLTDHMFCLNVALNIASSTRVEITLQTKPHPRSTLLHILAN